MSKPKRICIVHYEGKEYYSPVKEISTLNEAKIRSAKEERIRLGGENHHEEQCNMIPDIINESHGIHSTPCYKKFTLILSHDKIKSNTVTSTERRNSLRQPSSSTSTNWIYSKECNFCRKYKIQHKGRSIFPTKVSTKNAENTIKTAAEKFNSDLFFEIQDLDLIAKEFKYHLTPCYKQFTKGVSSNALFDNKNNSKDSSVYEKGNLEAVRTCIQEQVLSQNQVVSMNILHELYGLQPNDSRYRHVLKKRLQEKFPDQLCFLTAKSNTAEVVINASAVNAHKDDMKTDSNILKVAEHLRNDISKYSKKLPELRWPPTVNDLTSEERNPPESLINFLTHLLRSEKHSTSRSENLCRLVDSYAADLIHGVTRGDVVTSKHFLLALGLHSLTGQRKVVEINHNLGHCISYSLTCEIETAQARAAQVKAERTSLLPLKPKNEGDTVVTYFWVDNFDCNVDTQKGGGSVHSTHLVAFQEESSESSINDVKINLERTNSRSINTSRDNNCVPIIDVRKEPPLINSTSSTELEATGTFLSKYISWLILRKLNAFDQLVPTFSAWQTDNRIRSSAFKKVKKTVETYLPPIDSKVTDFSTIFQYLRYLQGLAADINMPYVNVTLDVGAAVNAFKVVWNYTDDFENVLLHLGDFHFMKENFKVCITYS